MELAEPVQMNIHQSSIYRKDLGWLQFENELKTSREAVSEEPTALRICFCSLFNNPKWQLGAPAQTWQQNSMQVCLVDL